MRIGNREDARNVGGFNLFGRAFGDDDQDIVLLVTYHNKNCFASNRREELSTEKQLKPAFFPKPFGRQ